MNIVTLLGRSIVAAARMLPSLWPWALGLFAIDLGGALAGGPGVPRAVGVLAQALGFALTALVALRFYAAHLDVAYRPVMADRTRIGRFAAWYCFLGALQIVASPEVLGGHVPPLVAMACRLGAVYFSLRLIAILPAVVAWRDWPGVDRIWNGGRDLAWRIAGLWFVLGMAVLLIGVGIVMALHLDAHGLTALLRRQNDAAWHSRPWVVLVLALAGCAMQCVSFAFDAGCFRIVRDRKA